MKRCIKLIRDDWTDLEYGTTKFVVSEIAMADLSSRKDPLVPSKIIFEILYAHGLEEWCLIPGSPFLKSNNDANPIVGTMLIEIEPIDNIKAYTWDLNGDSRQIHSCSSCRVIRKIEKISQLI